MSASVMLSSSTYAKGYTSYPGRRRLPIINQDRERAGLGLTSMHVIYAKLTCTYLAKALNDKAPLGCVTRPMLMLQNEIIDESLKQGPSARYLRQTSHYHLARQLTVLQTSGLELTVPAGHRDLQGTSLSSTLSKARYDPCYLGLEQVIPPEIYHKLLEITDNFAELCLPNKQKVILLSTSEIALKFGRVLHLLSVVQRPGESVAPRPCLWLVFRDRIYLVCRQS